MNTRVFRPAIVVAVIVAASGVFAAGVALRPALAGGEAIMNSIVTCAKTTACQTYKNTNTGPGIEGDNTSASNAATAGVLGTSTGIAAGVEGINNSSTGSVAVLGVSTGPAAAVKGLTSGAGAAFVGQATGSADGMDLVASSGAGVYAQSAYDAGVSGFSDRSYGVQALTASSVKPALAAASAATAAINAASGGAVAIDSDNTNGSGFGLLSITPPSGNAYPLVARDSSNNNLFYVDGFGNVFYHGTLTHFAIARGGNVAESYSSTTASPTIEDNGTARLINGEATVALDPAFAHAIDMHQVYQVMLTPDGDTRGLYTAVKTPTSFTVREVQGGRGTLDFDYHIYAPAMGQAGVRMRELTPAQAIASGPRSVPIPVFPKHVRMRAQR